VDIDFAVNTGKDKVSVSGINLHLIKKRPEKNRYETGQKAVLFPGFGVAATGGSSDENS
jgi:hypothetical protein